MIKGGGGISCRPPVNEPWSVINRINGVPQLYHRDYKRIEAASDDESRDKLNKSNGGPLLNLTEFMLNKLTEFILRCPLYSFST